MIDPSSPECIDYARQITRLCISILIKNQTYDGESSVVLRFPCHDLFDIQMLQTMDAYSHCSTIERKKSEQYNKKIFFHTITMIQNIRHISIQMNNTIARIKNPASGIT